LPRRGGRLQRWLCGSILSAVGQGTPPNSLRDLWRTSDLKGEVVPAQDRLCPWPPAARQQAATLADQERLLSAVDQRGSCSLAAWARRKKVVGTFRRARSDIYCGSRVPGTFFGR